MLLDIDNPIWFREKRAHSGRIHRVPWWNRTARAGLVAMWLASFAFISATVYRDFVLLETAIRSVFLQIVYISARSLIVGSAVISRERDLQTWDTLMSTPLRLERVVTGKYLTVVLPLMGELALAAPFLCLFLCGSEGHHTYLKPDRPLLILSILGLSVACIFFFSALGLFISAGASTTTRAATTGVVAAAILLGGTWLGDCYLTNLSACPDFIQPALSILNPVVGLTSFVFRYGPHRNTGLYDPMVGIGTLVLYGILTLFFLWWTKIRLSMNSGR